VIVRCLLLGGPKLPALPLGFRAHAHGISRGGLFGDLLKTPQVLPGLHPDSAGDQRVFCDLMQEAHGHLAGSG
jgi:hypothetical protein